MGYLNVYLLKNGSTNIHVFVYSWPSGDHPWLAESTDAELTDIECGLQDIGILGFCHQQLGTNPPQMLRDGCMCMCVYITEMKQPKKEEIK